MPISPSRAFRHRFIPPVTNGAVLPSARNDQPHGIVRGFESDLLLAAFVVLALVALGVLGRADLTLTSLGVDARATLSFAFHYFAFGLSWHM